MDEIVKMSLAQIAYVAVANHRSLVRLPVGQGIGLPVQHDAAALEHRGEGDIVDVAIDVQVLEPRLEVSAHRVIAGVEPPAFRFGHDQRAPIWPSLRRACQSAMAPRTLSTCRRATASASAASFFMTAAAISA